MISLLHIFFLSPAASLFERPRRERLLGHVLRTVLLPVLLLLASTSTARADLRLYQYDGDMPFIQMMLNMMVAMGMIDRVPPSLVYGSAYAHTPYQRTYGGSPFQRSPWLNSPWLKTPWPGSSWQNTGQWGNPYWGVLPLESYSPYGPYAYHPHAGDSLLEGWVNEPWETSAWNPDAVAEAKASSPAGQTAQQTLQPAPQVTIQLQHQPAPAIQQQTPGNVPSSSVSSPLARLAPPHVPDAASTPPYEQPTSPARQGGQAKVSGRSPVAAKPGVQAPPIRQKPCITDFCGLAKPDIDGLWLSQNGEMLGIKNRHFLWSDSRSRYLSGRLKLGNDYLWVSIDETSDGPVAQPQVMQFKYKLAGNRLLTMQPDGVIKEFVRAPAY